MNVSPINYNQCQFVSQNLKQQNSTVNFKGYIHEETIRYVQNSAKKKCKGNKNAAQQYVDDIINKLKKIMKKYPKDVYVKLENYKLEKDNYVVARFGHRNFQTNRSSALLEDVNLNDMEDICNKISGLNKKEQIVKLINAYKEEAYNELEQGNNADKLINVINQLSRQIGEEQFEPNLNLRRYLNSKQEYLVSA